MSCDDSPRVCIACFATALRLMFIDWALSFLFFSFPLFLSNSLFHMFIFPFLFLFFPPSSSIGGMCYFLLLFPSRHCHCMGKEIY